MDALTLHVWTRAVGPVRGWAAKACLSYNSLLAAAGVAGLITFLLMWNGLFLVGLICGVAFLIFALASAPRGWTDSAFATAPLFWSWAWSHALTMGDHAMSPLYGLMVLWAAVGGGAADLVIAILFSRRFDLHIGDWRPFDTRFMLVAASPAINLAILAAGWVVGRPDAAMVVVAWWSMISAIVHAVRLAQAGEWKAGGKPVTAWRGQ